MLFSLFSVRCNNLSQSFQKQSDCPLNQIRQTQIIFRLVMTSWMTSQRIFNMNNIAKNINSLSSPDPISGIYILREWNHSWATNYVNYVHRLHGDPFFSAPLCTNYCNQEHQYASQVDTAEQKNLYKSWLQRGSAEYCKTVCDNVLVFVAKAA